MYDPRQIFKQEPAAIKAALVALVTVFIVSGTITISSSTLASAGTAFELVAGLLYVRQLTVTKKALSDLKDAQDESELRGMAATRSRPLRAQPVEDERAGE